MHRLTVSLVRMVPPTRRQVEVPSDLTLAGLHEVIQVLFDWDGDHLYEFVVGRRTYADPDYLEACEDDEVSLAEVAGRVGKVIGYTYDLGACWEHRIVVDAVEPAGAGARLARCVAGVGPYPAEYDGDRPRRLDLDGRAAKARGGGCAWGAWVARPAGRFPQCQEPSPLGCRLAACRRPWPARHLQQGRHPRACSCRPRRRRPDPGAVDQSVGVGRCGRPRAGLPGPRGRLSVGHAAAFVGAVAGRGADVGRRTGRGPTRPRPGRVCGLGAGPAGGGRWGRTPR